MNNCSPIVSDAVLWQAAAQGDNNAFDELYRRYWPALLDEAYKRLKVREDAEDVVQNLFINLYDRLGVIEIKQDVASYLYRAVQYSVYKRMRKYISDRRMVRHLESHHIAEMENTLNTDIEYKELSRSIQHAINSLPKKCRRAFLLHRELQCNYSSVGHMLNISERTVEKHISKALRLLRKDLGLSYDYIFSILLLFTILT